MEDNLNKLKEEGIKYYQDISRRFGFFEINHKSIKFYPKVIQEVMGSCIIIRAEDLYIKRAISYHAFSKYFEKIPEGYMANEYEIIIEEKENELKWSFRKKE